MAAKGSNSKQELAVASRLKNEQRWNKELMCSSAGREASKRRMQAAAALVALRWVAGWMGRDVPVCLAKERSS